VRNTNKILNLKGKKCFEKSGLDRKIILQRILQKQSAGSCEYGNEPWGSIKGREFIDHQLTD